MKTVNEKAKKASKHEDNGKELEKRRKEESKWRREERKKASKHEDNGSGGQRCQTIQRATMSTMKTVMEKGRKELEKRRKAVMSMVNDDINREEG